MSLATRCTSCGTVFKVVQDQLKVSEGWVRCGRCSTVFNALEGLFDLSRDAMPGWSDTSLAALPDLDEDDAAPAPGGDASARPDSDLDVDLDMGADTAAAALAARAGRDDPQAEDAEDAIDAHLFRKKRVESAQVGARDRIEFSDARFDSDLFTENPLLSEEEAAGQTTTAALPLESQTPPDFVRRAERRARWQSTPMRLVLVAFVVVAACVLALQATHHWRDLAAAHWPSSRPLLASWCRLASCSIEAPRRIDDVSVESTALARAVGADAFVLSVTLKSRSAVAVALPAVDLSLTDGTGRLVARRALSAEDFRAARVIPSGAEAALQLMLNVRNARVAGYTVEIFYP